MGKVLFLVSICALIIGASLLLSGGGGIAIVLVIVALVAGVALLAPMLKRENRPRI